MIDLLVTGGGHAARCAARTARAAGVSVLSSARARAKRAPVVDAAA